MKKENRIKLGELIAIGELAESSNKWDNLAQEIFQVDAALSKPDNEWYNKFYVKTGALDAEISELKDKLKSPSHRLFFIIGPIGSGKTLLINYLLNEVVPSFNHNPQHEQRFCKTHRTQIKLDFDTVRKEYETAKEADIEDKFTKDVIINLLYNFRKLELISEEEEVSDFLHMQIQKNNGDTTFLMNLDNLMTTLTQDKSSEEANKIRHEIIKEFYTYCSTFDPENKYKFRLEDALVYYIQLWNYVIEKKYNNSTGCLPIVFDNIDKLPLFAQETVLKVVRNRIFPSDRGLIIFTMRPETFDRLNILHRYTNTADFISQQVPNLIDVLLNRLGLFIKDKGTYRCKCSECTDEEFQTKVGAISNFLKIIEKKGNGEETKSKTKENKTKEILENFLKNIFEQSIRNLLLNLNFLIKINSDFFDQKNFSISKLKRLILNQGHKFYEQEKNSYVENLFRVRENLLEGESYIKPLILDYLKMAKGKKITIRVGELKSDFEKLKFNSSLLPEALTQMLSLPKQLIISRGREEYDINNCTVSNSDEIEITKLGLNYITNLIFDLDYIQEVVLDTYSPFSYDTNREEIKKYAYKDTLWSRFTTIVDFFRELNGNEKETKPTIYDKTCKIFLDPNDFDALRNKIYSKEIFNHIYYNMRSILVDAISNLGQEGNQTNEQKTAFSDCRELENKVEDTKIFIDNWKRA